MKMFGVHWRTLLISVSLGFLGSFQLGYMLAAYNQLRIVLVHFIRESYKDQHGFEPEKPHKLLTPVVYCLGLGLGAGFSQLMADFLGRKRGLLMGALVTSIGHLFQIIASSQIIHPMLMFGSFLSGLGTGSALPIQLIFAWEVGSALNRRRLVFLSYLMMGIGSLAGVQSSSGKSIDEHHLSSVFLVPLLLLIFPILTCIFIQDTPHFFAFFKRDSLLAENSIKFYHPDDTTNHRSMLVTIWTEEEPQGFWQFAKSSGANLKIALVPVCLGLVLAITGSFVTWSYLSMIGPKASHLFILGEGNMVVLYCLLDIIGACWGLYLIEVIDLDRYLRGGLWFLIACLAVLGICLDLVERDLLFGLLTSLANKFLIIAMLGHGAAKGFTIWLAALALPMEMFPTKFRALVIGPLMSSTTLIGQLLLYAVYRSLYRSLGYPVLLFLVLVPLILLSVHLFHYKKQPETEVVFDLDEKEEMGPKNMTDS